MLCNPTGEKVRSDKNKPKENARYKLLLSVLMKARQSKIISTKSKGTIVACKKDAIINIQIKVFNLILNP